MVANLETVDGASNFKDIVASNDHHLGQIIMEEMGWNHHLDQITWIDGGNEHIDQIIMREMEMGDGMERDISKNTDLFCFDYFPSANNII